MLFAVFFTFWRFLQIVTLIPTVGMLSYFVHGYTSHNILTPDYILILFIVSVLAVVWAICTLFSYHRSSSNARFVALIDMCFVGALIAGVYYQGFIANVSCVHVVSGSAADVRFGIFGTTVTIQGFDISVDKTCALVKTCFAFGIMNCVFFFFTAFLAWFHGDRADRDKERYYEETRYRRSGSRRSGAAPRRSGSHQSNRSRGSHSRSRGAYV